MSYQITLGPCINCRKLIGFNANHAPSLIVEGKREPLCLGCHKRWYEMRGLPPEPVHPEAYKPTPTK